MKIVDKPWGHEEILVNEAEYCSKKLCLAGGTRVSLQYHKVKKETLIVTHGEVVLEHNGKTSTMRPGDLVTILPGEVHRFGSAAPAEILEVSTHHEDADTYRLEPGGKFNG